MEMSAGFFLLFLLVSLGSPGQIRMTKTPNVISTSPRETVTITCKPREAVHDANPKFHALSWNHQKPEQSPPPIIYHAYRQNARVSDRFSRTVSKPDVVLKMSNPEILDDGSPGQIRMAKTSNVISTSPKETVFISCEAVNDANRKSHAWNHQKPEQSPPPIIYHAYRQNTGVPDRFSRTVSEPDVVFKIFNSQMLDEANYYCLQPIEHPNTQSYGAVQKPSACVY